MCDMLNRSINEIAFYKIKTFHVFVGYHNPLGKQQIASTRALSYAKPFSTAASAFNIDDPAAPIIASRC